MYLPLWLDRPASLGGSADAVGMSREGGPTGSLSLCSGSRRLGRGSLGVGRSGIPRLEALSCLWYAIAQFISAGAEPGVQPTLMSFVRFFAFLMGVLN